MVSIKKTAILLIEKPIFCINTCKRVLLGSYDQETCDFFDCNIRLDATSVSLALCLKRQHRWRIRLASGSKQAARARGLAQLALCLRAQRIRQSRLSQKHKRHLSQKSLDSRPRCLYFVLFRQILGTARSNFTAKATEVYDHL